MSDPQTPLQNPLVEIVSKAQTEFRKTPVRTSAYLVTILAAMSTALYTISSHFSFVWLAATTLLSLGIAAACVKESYRLGRISSWRAQDCWALCYLLGLALLSHLGLHAFSAAFQNYCDGLPPNAPSTGAHVFGFCIGCALGVVQAFPISAGLKVLMHMQANDAKTT